MAKLKIKNAKLKMSCRARARTNYRFKRPEIKHGLQVERKKIAGANHQ